MTTLVAAPRRSRERGRGLAQGARDLLGQHRVLRVVLQRVVLMIPTALFASIMTFLLIHMIPGGPAQARLGVNATAGGLAAIKHQLGLDRPLYTQYWSWLTGVLHGDFGRSLQTNQPVSSELSTRLPVTVELVILATLLTIIVALPLGVLAARRAGTRTDASIRTGSGVGLAIPDFFLAIILIDVLAVGLHWLPELGYTKLSVNPPSNLQHLVLPTLALAAGAGAVAVRQVRAAMIDVLDHDYVRTARAMGVSERVILWKYALRNALPTILTVYGLLIIAMLGSTVILEQVFVLPGLGGAVTSAIDTRDYTVLQGTVIVYVILVLVINLLVDIAAAVANPSAGEAS